MPAIRTKPSEITVLSKHRKQEAKGKPRMAVRAPPELKDVPAVVVRGKDGQPVVLINLPTRDVGADMVLHLISQYPDSHVMTDECERIRLRDIVRVDCPLRGEIEVKAARQTARTDAPPMRPLMVRLNVRVEERVGLVNIPDSPEGLALFHAILQEFRTDRDGLPSGYTLFTTDYGYIPVHELAAANLPPKRSSGDGNPSR